MLADFERLMPGGEGVTWHGREGDLERRGGRSLDPDHALQYHPPAPALLPLGGPSRTSAEIIDHSLPLSRKRLLDNDPRDPGIIYRRNWLADAHRDLNAMGAVDHRIYRECPRTLSEYDHSFGRGVATPATLLAEMMAGGCRFVEVAAATVKGIEQALDAYPGGAIRLAEAPFRHEQLPLFG